MTSCIATSRSILRFQATSILPLMTSAFSCIIHERVMRLSVKQCLQSVNNKQFPIQMTQDKKHNNWLEILDFQPKLLWRTPTKIHRERRRRRQQEATRKAQRTSPSTAKATSTTSSVSSTRSFEWHFGIR